MSRPHQARCNDVLLTNPNRTCHVSPHLLYKCIVWLGSCRNVVEIWQPILTSPSGQMHDSATIASFPEERAKRIRSKQITQIQKTKNGRKNQLSPAWRQWLRQGRLIADKAVSLLTCHILHELRCCDRTPKDLRPPAGSQSCTWVTLQSLIPCFHPPPPPLSTKQLRFRL